MNVGFFRKIAVCAIAGLNGLFGIHETFRLLLKAYDSVVSEVSFSVLFAALIFIPVWQIAEKKGKWNTLKILDFWKASLCYFVAIDLCMFASRKIFHLQFYAPEGLTDKVASSLSGEQLTIVYFSHSYAFGLIIAVMQICGSLLLLFRRTRLLGAFVLFPVVANIILIDIFYDVETGALIQAIVIGLALLYLFFMEWKNIFEFFFSRNRQAKVSGFVRFGLALLRFSTVAIPMVICFILYDYPNRHPEISGRYEVSKLNINHREIDLKSCSDSMLTKVYFDDNHDVVFERNSLKRWRVGHFSYNKQNRSMKVIWRYPKGFHDTLWATLSAKDKQRNLTLSGIMGRDTLVAVLVQKQAEAKSE
ncbi:hypothetical protein FNO01nite_28450 [Flavobacterium noncentrifugens]|uniref:Uncharacterized protein n=1 Tax=Flavobacterium noncentrifugens TaxID=1128970 RepID=A0A1G8XSW4_9FLAO|nr:hypothetical protein [Flavobacterium noncentrifugens]GEP52173.1 hypothetical protein FNO01nite_28450 [Flavobacterium noncentrifugens]SDJ93618.1 hypothetical protein SAMN04487935_2051 [Flavobacterium noncentrifugens]